MCNQGIFLKRFTQIFKEFMLAKMTWLCNDICLAPFSSYWKFSHVIWYNNEIHIGSNFWQIIFTSFNLNWIFRYNFVTNYGFTSIENTKNIFVPRFIYSSQNFLKILYFVILKYVAFRKHMYEKYDHKIS